jgi:hypothetical protein
MKKEVRVIKNLKNFYLRFCLILLFGIIFFSVDVLSASSDPSVCCERTTDGALCVNTQEENCASDALQSPTSCETTSYCKLGTCYDSSEGICMENTPRSVCDQNSGTWDSRKIEEVPQCKLGCCILGDQAAYVSLVRCKQLSTYFGIENNYDTSITSEVACIATAQSQDKGACVYEEEFERICEFTTRDECGASEVVEVAGEEIASGKTFYKDYLCSAEELNTACARQISTTCKSGSVYWTDSCGNLENVYSKDKDKSWNNGRVIEADSVCTANDGSDPNCGNCDYILGSSCAEWGGVLGIGGPSDGDYYCQASECTDRNGEKRVNGESWCVYDGKVGNGLDSVGSRHFREICIDGDVQVEACSDFRNEICISGGIKTLQGEFGTAACRVNRWRDCTFQGDRDRCLNADKRDCIWENEVTGLQLFGGTLNSDLTFSNPSSGDGFGNPTSDGGFSSPSLDPDNGICLPSFSPGLEFWEDSGANTVCGQAKAKCTVVYEKGLIDGSWYVKSGGECLKEEWAASADKVCSALGDCGGYINYVGDFSDDGYEWKVNGESKEFSPNTENKIKSGFTGYIIETITDEKVL